MSAEPNFKDHNFKQFDSRERVNNPRFLLFNLIVTPIIA